MCAYCEGTYLLLEEVVECFHPQFVEHAEALDEGSKERYGQRNTTNDVQYEQYCVHTQYTVAGRSAVQWHTQESLSECKKRK